MTVDMSEETIAEVARGGVLAAQSGARNREYAWKVKSVHS
eukprot:CAMPEP_0201285848 /NCGR_PEP_ID=MMETSP1317-20130820/113907_1 /ASSEMBLY_ACC=CAM_ASM_000770 /TAXON_ID=187299 /ORGANISM="Undescribed Undescribed, Strain Undescribed" /LENGTH=39 /DNA_ID= /DNA_START= /DNA_END= /DNA_ORIENTATION=